ncbi:linear gramicidin synthase subunit A [Clostridiales bacterium]|nr:linear gramicidin synthase subunit A [Clostridiales bacterium]
MYKSGDLAYRNDEGVLVYCGRMDDMVKLNGHRVRLGEIEQKILSSGLVDSAAVKVINRNGGVWVCAYVVTDQENCSDALLETLRRDLPEFMIPKQVMQIPQIPLNKNGKVDRARLPDPPVQIKDVNRHNDREQFKQLMNVAQDLFLNKT